jgi:hypothetical protein
MRVTEDFNRKMQRIRVSKKNLKQEQAKRVFFSNRTEVYEKKGKTRGRRIKKGWWTKAVQGVRVPHYDYCMHADRLDGKDAGAEGGGVWGVCAATVLATRD